MSKYTEAVTDSNLAVVLPMAINRWRIERGLTQEQLAVKCGMKQSRISQIEDLTYEGKYSLTTLRRIASALDLSIEIRFVAPAAEEQK